MSIQLATASQWALSLGQFVFLSFSVDSIPLSTWVGAIAVAVVFLALTMWIILQRWQRRRNLMWSAGIQDVELGSAARPEAAAALTPLMSSAGIQDVGSAARPEAAAALTPPEDGVGLTEFHYDELADATDNFDEGRKLGQGGFGTVFYGILGGCKVAIKRITWEGNGGEKSFMAEVRTIGQLNHKNLVRLLGWCRAVGRGFFVVYEYMPNRSLDRHLFCRSVAPGPTVVVDGNGEGSRLQQQPLTPLPWEKRYNIVLGLASAIKYLHEDLRECVVHRDIKPANVMLDADFEARLGDFGLARFVEHGNSVVTIQNAGTPEYMAPEVLHQGRGPSKESDVYSFGVVALEVACGKKASSQPEVVEEKLVAWVRRCHETGDLLRAADRELGGRFDKGQMRRRLMVVGLMCTMQDRHRRPSITQVIHYLHPKATIPNVPADTPPALSIPPHTHRSMPITFGPPITISVIEVGATS